jgi:chorismate mutase
MDMATAAAVREIVVTANEEALNTAITENQIQPEKIISVAFEPRRHLAIGDNEAKYRVLYRL